MATSRRAKGLPHCLLLAVLGGTLLAGSFPPLNLWPFAWIALAPLLSALPGCRLRWVLLTGYVCGLVLHGALNAWIPAAILSAAPSLHLSRTAVEGLALVAFAAAVGFILAPFFALFAAAVPWATATLRPVVRCLFIAALWTALEYVWSLGPLGYPWAALGYSQWKVLPLIQIAAWTGVYGLSFLIVLFNAAAAEGLRNGRTRGSRKPLKVVVSLLVLAVALGIWQRSTDRTGRPLSVAVVQGNFDNLTRGEARQQVRMALEYARLSHEATHSRRTEVVVWPETALLSPLSLAQAEWRLTADAARSSRCSLLTGGVEWRVPQGPFNVAAVFGSDGSLGDIYRKRHLVPFGEYTPGRQRWERLAILSIRDRDFRPGRVPGVVRVGDSKAGVLICFESAFPWLARDCVRRGAEWLAVLTNDAWLQHSSACEHHATLAVLRAVEFHRPVVRAANTGLSWIVDDRGRVVEALGLNRRGVVRAEVKLNNERTFYSRHGDYLPQACLVYCLVVLCWILVKQRRTGQRENGITG